MVPPPSSCTFTTLISSVRNGFHSVSELVGCTKSDKPVTEETLKQQFYGVLTVGIISCALLIIGLLGQLGLFPMGGAGTAFTFVATAGILVTAYAGYQYWKKLAAYEQEVREKAAQEAAAQNASAPAGTGVTSYATQFLGNRFASIRGYLGYEPGTPKAQ